MSVLGFGYEQQILKKFQHLNAAVLFCQRIDNERRNQSLAFEYQKEQRQVYKKIGDTPLSALEPLSAWREVFRSFGVNPTRYRSAPEALLRRLMKKGDIPGINDLVDICNLISIRYAIAVAAFDLVNVEGQIEVRFADGEEEFTPLGSEVSEHPDRGEVIFRDHAGMVLARRWCWRQSAESAANPNTNSALVTVEAHHTGSGADIKQAASELNGLLQDYLGSECRGEFLVQGRKSFQF
jgi:DNA/RNA-binding domain of Phe-tRNA-synthetase-like protein